MEHDPREQTGDIGYDMAHEATGDRSRSQDGVARSAPADEGRDDDAGDYAYDEAHDFRR